MSSKTILKKTEAIGIDTSEDMDETNIVLEDGEDKINTLQDGGAKDDKKIQIKKKESSVSAASAASTSKPASKIIKKKVSITEEPKEKQLDTKPEEQEKSQIRRNETKEDKKETDKKEVLVDVSKALKASKKPSKKQDISEIFNDDDVDYRYIITNYDFSKNKTLPKITRYEKALLVGKRAKQIEEGAIPNVKVLPGQTSIDIAEEELRQRKIPFIIKRPIGNKFEYWKPIDMEVIMD